MGKGWEEVRKAFLIPSHGFECAAQPRHSLPLLLGSASVPFLLLFCLSHLSLVEKCCFCSMCYFFLFFVDRFSLSLREGMSPAACDFSFCFAMCLLLSLAVNIIFWCVHCSASVGAYGLIIAGLSRLPFSFFLPFLTSCGFPCHCCTAACFVFL